MTGVPDDLIAAAEAAALAGVCRRTVYGWIARGKLPAWQRAGGRTFVSRSDVLGLFRRKAVAGEVGTQTVSSAGRAVRDRRTTEILRRAGFSSYQGVQ